MFGLGFVLLTGVLTGLRARALVWAVVLYGWLLFWSLAEGFGALNLTAWGVTLALNAILGMTAVRKRWISDPLYDRLKNVIPDKGLDELNELARLTPGGLDWAGELLSGLPDWKALLALSPLELTAEERDFLDGPVEDLCAMVDDWKCIEELHDLPREVWDALRRKKFFAMILPKEHGGLGFSPYAHAEVVQKLASRSVALATTAMVPNSIGPAELLLRYGTKEQKETWLPRLASGEEIPCFALTGVQAGSDAVSNSPDRGVVCKGTFEDKEVLGIRLTFEKRYITLAPVATVLGLAFHLYDPDHMLGEKSDLGMTFAVVPADLPGIEKGRRHNPLNLPFMNGPIQGTDVFIPLDMVIGGREGIGKGRTMLLENLSTGRAISMPALSSAGAKTACRATGAYARVRSQFGLPLSRFEGVREPLARMAGRTYLLEGGRLLALMGLAGEGKPLVASSMLKQQSTELMRQIAADAMDVQGGSGICLGPRNIFGPMHMASPLGITVEGANILTRTMLIFGLGGPISHPYMLDELAALTRKDEDQGRRDFDRLLASHLGWTLSNALRALVHGLSNGRLARTPKGAGKKHFQDATRLSAALALAADLSLLALGQDLRRREHLCGRLSDAWSLLFLVSGTLLRFEHGGHGQQERPLLDWACREGLHLAEQALAEALDNYPLGYMGTGLKALVFPLGRKLGPPNDAVADKAAAVMIAPSAARDRLTQGIYLPQDRDEPLARYERALEAVRAAQEAEKKLRHAVRDGKLTFGLELEMVREAREKSVLDQKEADIVERAVRARREVIEVDDYPFAYWNS